MRQKNIAILIGAAHAKIPHKIPTQSEFPVKSCHGGRRSPIDQGMRGPKPVTTLHYSEMKSASLTDRQWFSLLSGN
jgi:hypothetical protein